MAWGPAILAGAVAGFLSPPWLAVRERYVAAWCAFAVVLLVMIWFGAMSGNAQRTRLRAAANDPGKNLVLLVIFAACAVGLVAALGVLGHDPASRLHPRVSVTLSLLAIALSWTLIHTAMTLRYAHLYYFDDGFVGGLEIPGCPEPTDYDFAYFAFVIGMTFQTSDVNVTDSSIRRLALLHGLISFWFNIAIIAVTVNIATGLLH